MSTHDKRYRSEEISPQVKKVLVAKAQEEQGKGAEEEKERMESPRLQTTVATAEKNCVQTNKKVEKNEVVAKQDSKLDIKEQSTLKFTKREVPDKKVFRF